MIRITDSQFDRADVFADHCEAFANQVSVSKEDGKAFVKLTGDDPLTAVALLRSEADRVQFRPKPAGGRAVFADNSRARCLRALAEKIKNAAQ